MKGKLFQQIASAALTAALVITGIPSAFAADAASDQLSASYDMSVDTLSIDVDLATVGKKMISVIVAPAEMTDYAPDVLSADDRVILKTVQTDIDGIADIVIVMPEGFLGRYVVNIGANGNTYRMAILDVDEGSIDEMYTQFAAGNYAAVAAGLENPLTDETDAANIAAYIESNIATVTDAQTAAQVYMAAEGIAYVMSGKLSFAEALATYYPYIGVEYLLDYELTLTEDEQAVVEELFQESGTDDTFANMYSTSKFMAQYKYSESAVELKELVLERVAQTNSELVDKYDSIGNDSYQEKVFDNMYSDKASITDYASVVKAFEDQVKKQTSAAKDAKENSGSSSGGSSSSGGNRGGSGVGVSTGTITTAKPEVTPDVAAPVFSDIADHWAKASIESMYAKGVINGVGDGSFKPDVEVTRAEFAKMIVAVLGLDATGDASFTDVADDSWYNGYVAAAAGAGIVQGTDAGEFMPELYITRQDAAVMLARVLQYKGITLDAQSVGFNDEAKIADYAKDSVNGMAALDIITGYNGGFAPLDNTTRAQAAVLLERVAAHIG